MLSDDDSTPLIFTTLQSDPDELVNDIIQDVLELNISEGISNSLDAKLQSSLGALDDLNENNDVSAVNNLYAFINAIQAQRGKKISEADADAMIESAQMIIDLLTQN